MPAPFLFPQTPAPSSVSTPTRLDPSLRFAVDQGYELRRARHSRPRRRWHLDYLGLSVTHLREFQDFLGFHRLGVVPFQFGHLTAAETATVANTTPVILTLPHAYVTGQWVGIPSATVGAGLVGLWQLTRLSLSTFSLNGSTAQGAGQCAVYPYVPYAIGYFPDDQWDAPVKLLGPDSVDYARAAFNMTIAIEEIF